MDGRVREGGEGGREAEDIAIGRREGASRWERGVPTALRRTVVSLRPESETIGAVRVGRLVLAVGEAEWRGAASLLGPIGHWVPLRGYLALWKHDLTTNPCAHIFRGLLEYWSRGWFRAPVRLGLILREGGVFW